MCLVAERREALYLASIIGSSFPASRDGSSIGGLKIHRNSASVRR